MDTQNTIMKIQSAVKNAPLESILEKAKSIEKAIPAAGPAIAIVIKLLNILIKYRPLANNVLSTGVQASAFFQNANNDNAPIDENASDVSRGSSKEACELSEEEDAEATERAEILAMLDQMVEIVAEDGDISDEEKGHLIDIAHELGMNENELLAKVKMYCLSKK